MADWLNMREINALRDRLEADAAEITEDGDLTPAARARRAREIAADFEASYNAEKGELERAIEQHRHTLTRKAYPAEEIGKDVQRELLEEMAAGRMERDIAAQAEAGGFNPVEALEAARYRGDTARQVVIERVGRRYLPDDEELQKGFARLVEEGRRERMTPSQRAGLEELEAFEHRAGEIGQALALADRIVRARLEGLKKMPVPEDRSGLSNRAAGIGAGGQPGQGWDAAS